MQVSIALIGHHPLQIDSPDIPFLDKILGRPTALGRFNHMRLCFVFIPLAFIHITIEEEAWRTICDCQFEPRICTQVGIIERLHTRIAIRYVCRWTNNIFASCRTCYLGTCPWTVPCIIHIGQINLTREIARSVGTLVNAGISVISMTWIVSSTFTTHKRRTSFEHYLWIW